MTTREQGDFGERSAMCWLLEAGAQVAIPFGHSPDWDLLAELDGRLIRVQVKTSGLLRKERWHVMVCTRGGNQSWNGIAKYFDAARCDYLFVHVGDGRRWFIPSDALGGRSSIALGGPKYAEFEVERGQPFSERRARRASGSTIAS
jgi:PD-(D/E)XK endonuclease